MWHSDEVCDSMEEMVDPTVPLFQTSGLAGFWLP